MKIDLHVKCNMFQSWLDPIVKNEMTKNHRDPVIEYKRLFICCHESSSLFLDFINELGMLKS